MFKFRGLRIGILILGCAYLPADAQLRGHGGPVRALAVSPDGQFVISGSFDTTVIRWSLDRSVAEQVLRFHDGAVNAVVFLKDGRFATAGEDARIAIWKPGDVKPQTVLQGHTGPIVALVASQDGIYMASASWDGTARVWTIGDGTSRTLEGHSQNVNAVAFAADGDSLVTAGYDATVRIWPFRSIGSPVIVRLPSTLNALGMTSDGQIVVGGGDGKVYFLSPTGTPLGTADAGSASITTLALSNDGRLVAAANLRGSVAILDRQSRFLIRELNVSGLPNWSVAFLPNSHTLLTGGADRLIRRWNVDTGAAIDAVAARAPDDALAAYAGDPGADVFRACVACHTLRSGEGDRAGPTLAGLFGRRIATLPGYEFSEALKKLDIVWTPETVSKLFEYGPMTYTPGTKMPEQRIGSKRDREALMAFLSKATASK